MKIIYFFLFVVFPFVGFSQEYKIPKIPFDVTSKKGNEYIELFGLKDTTALIVHMGLSRHSVFGLESDYVVYLSNGKVKRYKVSWQTNKVLVRKKKRIRIKKSKLQKYWEFLNKCIVEGKLPIDKEQLKTTGEKANTLKQAISGGQTSYLGFYQGKKQMEYSSFIPSMFISEEYSGHKEKQKLVDVMTGFENLFE